MLCLLDMCEVTAESWQTPMHREGLVKLDRYIVFSEFPI